MHMFLSIIANGILCVYTIVAVGLAFGHRFSSKSKYFGLLLTWVGLLPVVLWVSEQLANTSNQPISIYDVLGDLGKFGRFGKRPEDVGMCFIIFFGVGVVFIVFDELWKRSEDDLPPKE